MHIEKNILFIQLPLVDHSLGYIQGNIPYAGACIMGYINRHINTRCKTEQLPYILENFASDEVILKYILKTKPDLIGFSTYLWNLERHLRIADRIKEAAPGITLIMGGPEISSGSFAFHKKQPCIDFFVSGEGEWFFHRFLEGQDLTPYSTEINGNIFIIQPGDELIDTANIVEPFTGNYLNPMPDGSIFLELTRGCPYRCSYCYYSKNCRTIREMSFDNLLSALESTRGLSDIYILSPTLDRSKDFTQKLELLASRNRGISLHSEMRTGNIDAKTAKLLNNAGFKSMEVGLQSLNPEVLKRVRRGSDPEAELRGMDQMREAGIDIKIGIIPGLPGESPESFDKTVDRLTSMGFHNEIELYPLMILPGTGIRDEADREKIKYQKKPPYFYFDGWGLSFQDIVSITEDIEARTGYSQSLSSLPDFTLNEKGYLVKAASLDGERDGSWDPCQYIPFIETSCFDFHITSSKGKKLLPGLKRLLSAIPTDVLYTFIIHGNGILNEDKLLNLLDGFTCDSITARLNIFNSYKDSSTFRFFQVFTDLNDYSSAFNSYSYIDPILRIGNDNAAKVLRFLSENNPSGHFVLAGKNLEENIREKIFELYRDCPEMTAFLEKETQLLFYLKCGQEYIETPCDFRLKSF